MSGGGLQRQAEMRESGFDAPEFAMVCHALAGIASTWTCRHRPTGCRGSRSSEAALVLRLLGDVVRPRYFDFAAPACACATINIIGSYARRAFSSSFERRLSSGIGFRSHGKLNG